MSVLRMVLRCLCPFPALRVAIWHKPIGILKSYVKALVNLPKTYRTIENIDYKLNLLCDYYFDVRNVRKAIGALREYQEKDVDLLRTFISICSKHNLTYWLDFGSLLGSYRHSGFVPWDNDLDVSMPSDFYERLREYASEFEKAGMKITEPIKDVIIKIRYVNSEKYFMDVYSYSDEGNMVQLKLNLPNRYKVPIPKDVIFPTREIEFEGLLVNAPNDVERYLGCRYGNFMSFPHKHHDIDGHYDVNYYVNFDLEKQ